MSVNKWSFTIWALASFRPSHTIPAACHVTTLPAPPRHPLSQLPTLHPCPALPRMPCPFPSILQTPPSYGLSSNQLLLPSQGSPAVCLPRLSHTPTTGLPSLAVLLSPPQQGLSLCTVISSWSVLPSAAGNTTWFWTRANALATGPWIRLSTWYRLCGFGLVTPWLGTSVSSSIKGGCSRSGC